MINPKTTAEGNQMSLLSRLTAGLVERKWGFLFAELVLLVIGILIAFAIDGWVGDARDRQT